MPQPVPGYVTHYHLADRRPFLNLSDLDDAERAEVLDDLARHRETGQLRRVFGPRYMHLRKLTEARMRELFIAAGGRPERRAPHYFVLGHSQWFAGLADRMSAVRLELSALPDEATSVTYPDSFTAMAYGPDFGLPYEPQPYHARVYRLADLPELVSTYGLPDDTPTSYSGYQHRPFEKYIEVQLWSDDPIRSLGP